MRCADWRSSGWCSSPWNQPACCAHRCITPRSRRPRVCWRRFLLRAIGAAGGFAMFTLVRCPDRSRFNPEPIDVSLLVLAYCAVFGTLVWLATRQHMLARLGGVALLVATRLVGSLPGWL